jgi:predicted ATPase
MGHLVEAELLCQRGVPPRATYLFKHALIQEVAYQSSLKGTRQRYQQRVARALEERFPETVETQPELLAHYYTEVGLSKQAIAYWQRAGQQAQQRSPNPEAVQNLTKGLDLLATLPETLARAPSRSSTCRSPWGQHWWPPRVMQLLWLAAELGHPIGLR